MTTARTSAAVPTASKLGLLESLCFTQKLFFGFLALLGSSVRTDSVMMLMGVVLVIGLSAVTQDIETAEVVPCV